MSVLDETIEARADANPSERSEREFNSAGRKIKFIEEDFKKGNGGLRSTIVSKELGLYRQDYCGCGFSIR